MNDPISRHAAIDAVAELASSMSVCISVDECHGMKRMQGMAVRVLDELPSVQPEIIRCKDCKHWMREYLDINGKHGCNVMREYTAPNDYCYKAERKE